MNSVTQAIAKLSFVADEKGVQSTTTRLHQLAGAQGNVAVTSTKTEKATTSLQKRLVAIEKTYDRNVRAAMAMAKVQHDLNLIESQGLITAVRKAELLTLAAKKHAESAAATTAHARALAALNAQSKVVGGSLLAGAGLGGGAAILPLAAIGGMALFIKNSIEAQAALAQLEATLASTGGAAGLSAKELTALASELQRVTIYGDDAIISAESQLATFTKIGRDVFPAATEAVLDLATKMKGDLRGATIQVGKALNDPILGLTSLARAGIQFTDAQKDMIKEMVRVGDVAAAQAVILRELRIEFGGSAAAARETLGGALKALGNAFGDLFEVSGRDSRNLVTAINDVVDVLSDPATIGAIHNFGAGLFNAFADAIAGAREFATAVDQLSQGNVRTFLALTAYPTTVAGNAENFAARLRTGLVEMRADIAATEAFYESFGDTFERSSARAVKGVDDVAAAAERAKAALRSGLAGEVIAMSNLMEGRFDDAFGDASAAAKTHAKALADARKAAEQQDKAVAGVIVSLKFEQDQLGRTAREQAIYNELQRVGVDVASAYGRQIAEETGKLYDMRKAQDEARASMGVFSNALEGVFTGAIKDADQFFDSVAKGFGEIAAKQAVENIIESVSKLTASLGEAGKAVSALLGAFGTGYSTGSPLLGAITGLLTGGILTAIVGFIGGLIGKSREERQRKEAQAATRLATAQEKLRAAYEAQRAAVETRVIDAQNALRAAYEAQSSALQGTIDRMRTFIDGIKAFKDELKLDQSVSPLSPRQRLAEARRQFESTAALARSGDATAQGNLTGAARSYLDEARGFFASTTAYAAIFDQVNATLDQASAGAGAQLTTAQRQLAALDRQVGKLIDIDDSVKSVAAAIRELKAAQKAEKQFELVTKQVSKLIDIDNSVLSVARAITLLRNVIERNQSILGGSTSGGGRRQEGGMIPRYAGGGVIGNGVFDVDSVRARFDRGGDVMLAGGEFVNRATSVTPQTLPVLDYINRRGVPPANDNGAYFEALGAMLTRAMGATTAAQIAVIRDEMHQLRQEVRRLNDTQRIEAKRPARPGTKSAA